MTSGLPQVVGRLTPDFLVVGGQFLDPARQRQVGRGRGGRRECGCDEEDQDGQGTAGQGHGGSPRSGGRPRHCTAAARPVSGKRPLLLTSPAAAGHRGAGCSARSGRGLTSNTRTTESSARPAKTPKMTSSGTLR